MRPDELKTKLMEGLSDEEREVFEVGWRALDLDAAADKEALKESFRCLRPDFTESQLDICVEGRVKPESEWNLAETNPGSQEEFVGKISAAYRELNPGVSDDEVVKWATDNVKKVQAKSKEEDYGTATISHLVSAVLQDEKEKAEYQEIPDALAARYPSWSDQKRAAWLKKHEALLLAYKGLHPEWSGSQLVTAVDENPEGK